MTLPVMEDIEKILDNKPALRKLQQSASIHSATADAAIAAIAATAADTTVSVVPAPAAETATAL